MGLLLLWTQFEQLINLMYLRHHANSASIGIFLSTWMAKAFSPMVFTKKVVIWNSFRNVGEARLRGSYNCHPDNSFESGRTARQDQQVSTQAQTASSSSSSSSLLGWIIILYILWSVETLKEWRSRRSRLYNIGLHFSRLVLVDSCGKVFPIVVAGSVRSEFFPAESKNIIFVRLHKDTRPLLWMTPYPRHFKREDG